VLAGGALGRDRVGEDEKTRALPPPGGQPLLHQTEFLLAHRLPPPAGPRPPRRPPDGGPDRPLRSPEAPWPRSRGPPPPDEPARHLLPRADLRERAVLGVVQVDLDGLLMRVQPVDFHRDTAPATGVDPASLVPACNKRTGPARFASGLPRTCSPH